MRYTGVPTKKIHMYWINRKSISASSKYPLTWLWYLRTWDFTSSHTINPNTSKDNNPLKNSWICFFVLKEKHTIHTWDRLPLCKNKLPNFQSLKGFHAKIVWRTLYPLLLWRYLYSIPSQPHFWRKVIYKAQSTPCLLQWDGIVFPD